MTETIVQYQARRRRELSINPSTKAKPVPTNGEGTKNNTSHLFITMEDTK